MSVDNPVAGVVGNAATDATFNAVDTNGDGQISRSEFQKSAATGQIKVDSGSPTVIFEGGVNACSKIPTCTPTAFTVPALCLLMHIFTVLWQ